MKNLLLLICFGCILGSCSEMNDKHESYFKDGEIIYIGKVDSFKVFPGNERMLLQYWISDPRAKNLTISWALGKESLDIPIPVHQPAESFERYIGKNDKTIAEGSHTFKLVVWDDNNHKSVVVETNVNVYGQRYKSRLSNRPLISADAQGNDVTLKWAGATGNDEFGVNVSYINTSGTAVTKRYKSSEVTSTVIPDVQLTAPMTWQTLYLPEPTAIDTFFTDPQKVGIQSTVNVVLNKPVTHSDADPAANTGQMAVDGITSGSPTRWVSNNSNSEHWIEIDLQGVFDINAFKIWRDMSNAVQRTKQFRLQAEIADAWVDIVTEDNNEVAEYYKEFETVSTGKVRFYVPAYTDNRVRLFEIEVYSIIRY